MRSEHTFHVPCDTAPVGETHALRIIIEDRRVVYLAADCPEDAAADAAERLGMCWCCHVVADVRARLRGGTRAIDDTGLWSVLGPPSVHADGVREKKYASWVPDTETPLSARLWASHAARLSQEAPFECRVTLVDRMLFLFLQGVHFSRDLAAATKARGCRWVPDEQNVQSMAKGTGRWRIRPGRSGEEKCLVCDTGPYKKWEQHARSENHCKDAAAAIRRFIARLNSLPSVVGLPVPDGYDPLRTMSKDREKMRERWGVRPYA